MYIPYKIISAAKYNVVVDGVFGKHYFLVQHAMKVLAYAREPRVGVSAQDECGIEGVLEEFAHSHTPAHSTLYFVLQQVFCSFLYGQGELSVGIFQ